MIGTAGTAATSALHLVSPATGAAALPDDVLNVIVPIEPVAIATAAFLKG